jgi:hypothetical protein
MGLDTKTYWLTDRQSQYDFDFDREIELCKGGWEENLSAGSWKISTVRSRCQVKADEDTAGWKKA